MKILKFFAIALVAWMETTQAEDVAAQPPDQMILIPAGTFIDGLTSSNEDTFMRECLNPRKKTTCRQMLLDLKNNLYPKGASGVYVKSFYIDQYEVSVIEYIRCVKDGFCQALDISQGSCPIMSTYIMYAADSVYAHHPINCVSAEDAESYCHWQGKRLPTVTEWRKAARGASDDRFFPWGDASPSCDRVAANLYEESCYWFPGGDLSSCEALDPSHPCRTALRMLEFAWPTHSKPQGISPYGVFHMLGNVSEWVTSTSDTGEDLFYQQGGAFISERASLNVIKYLGPSDGEGRFPHIGFRCARSAE